MSVFHFDDSWKEDEPCDYSDYGIDVDNLRRTYQAAEFDDYERCFDGLRVRVRFIPPSRRGGNAVDDYSYTAVKEFDGLTGTPTIMRLMKRQIGKRACDYDQILVHLSDGSRHWFFGRELRMLSTGLHITRQWMTTGRNTLQHATRGKQKGIPNRKKGQYNDGQNKTVG